MEGSLGRLEQALMFEEIKKFSQAYPKFIPRLSSRLSQHYFSINSQDDPKIIPSRSPAQDYPKIISKIIPSPSPATSPTHLSCMVICDLFCNLHHSHMIHFHSASLCISPTNTCHLNFINWFSPPRSILLFNHTQQQRPQICLPPCPKFSRQVDQFQHVKS